MKRQRRYRLPRFVRHPRCEKSDHDRRKLDYYASSQLGTVSLRGELNRWNPRVLEADSSPDGRFILVRTTLQPYRLVDPFGRNPHRLEIYTAAGQRQVLVAEQPAATSPRKLRTARPRGGRPRDARWRADRPATLSWLEAQDKGDRLVQWAAPFTRAAEALFVSDARIHGVFWGDDHTAIVHDLPGEAAARALVAYRSLPARHAGSCPGYRRGAAGDPQLSRRPNGGRCSGDAATGEARARSDRDGNIYVTNYYATRWRSIA